MTMKKILTSLVLASSIFIITSCGSESTNTEFVKNFSIDNIDMQNYKEFQRLADKYKELSPLDTFKEISDNYNFALNEDQILKIRDTVCNIDHNSLPIGTAILFITGIPLTESQIDKLVGITVASFCPEEV